MYNYDKSFAIIQCNEIEPYDASLSSMRTMRADFVQNINGQYHSSGVFLLKKPTKILIDYNKGEVNAFVGVNGNLATYLDKDLEQISHIPKDKTPAHFILNGDKKLLSMNIIKCGKIENNEYAVTFVQDTNLISGKFTLIFNQETLDITRILVSQKGSDDVEIKFFNTKINTEIPDKNFIIKDPRL